MAEDKEDKIPAHVAIIPDGNRRWARQNGMIATAGHAIAAKDEHLRSLLKEAKNLGVKYVSLWGFSCENWKREQEEKDKIFKLINKSVKCLKKEAHKEKIWCRHIGRKDRIPEYLRNSLVELENETKDYDDFHVILCVDYGGRDELIRAVNKIIAEGKKNIDEEEFDDYLDTKEIPDVDLIIRTGGEQRVSGFMPYKALYAEFYFTDTYFPDFNAKELRKAIKEFGKRERRFGGGK